MQSEKLTKPARSGGKRRYDDACGAAHGLELVGERWALLVLRELMLGPRRFSELRADLPGISANVLAQRLTELEERGLVRRRPLRRPASATAYEATEWGLEAEPVLQELGRWAARSPSHDPSLPLSGVSLMLSLRTMIDPARAKGLDARIGFVIGDDHYVARLRKGKIKVARGELDDCDLVFSGPATALAGIIYGGQPLATVAIVGDARLAERFVRLFPLPAKVAEDH